MSKSNSQSKFSNPLLAFTNGASDLAAKAAKVSNTLAAARRDSSGYGTSSSGYGHAPVDYGYSVSYSSSGDEDCCPLVLDPLLLASLLGFVAAATYFLNVVITMVMPGRKRRRRRGVQDAFTEAIKELQWQGSSTIFWLVLAFCFPSFLAE